MSIMEVFAIKRAWLQGVKSGISAARDFVPPLEQCDGNTWRELATMEFQISENEDVKAWHHVWVHGFVFGYYEGTSLSSIPEEDLQMYDLAQHMKESMTHLG